MHACNDIYMEIYASNCSNTYISLCLDFVWFTVLKYKVLRSKNAAR